MRPVGVTSIVSKWSRGEAGDAGPTGAKELLPGFVPAHLTTNDCDQRAVDEEEAHVTCRFRVAFDGAPGLPTRHKRRRPDDLLWQHSDGRLAVWKMQGSWTNLSGDPLGLGQLPDPRWQLVASSDFNCDDHPDHIFQHQGDGRLAVWLMNGHAVVTGFALSPARVPDLNWKVRGAGDFNGDFRPDLIWQNEVTGQVSVWLMDGTTRREGGFVAIRGRGHGLADRRRGGLQPGRHSDLLWQHQSNGLIAVWYHESVSAWSTACSSPSEVSDPNLKIRAVGDVNGDERPDLVWQNQATGLLATWFMNDRATTLFERAAITRPRCRHGLAHRGNALLARFQTYP